MNNLALCTEIFVLFKKPKKKREIVVGDGWKVIDLHVTNCPRQYSQESGMMEFGVWWLQLVERVQNQNLNFINKLECLLRRDFCTKEN